MPEFTSIHEIIIADADLRIRSINPVTPEDVDYIDSCMLTASRNPQTLFDCIPDIPREELSNVFDIIKNGNLFPGNLKTYRNIIDRQNGERLIVVMYPETDDMMVTGIVCHLIHIDRRVKRNESIPDSEQFYQCVLKNNDDIIICISRDGMIDYINERINEYPGLNAEKLTGKHVVEIISPDDVSRIGQVVDHLKYIPSIDFNFCLNLTDDNVRDMTARIITIPSKNNGFLAICKDRTEAIDLEKKLIAGRNALIALNEITITLSSSNTLEIALTNTLEKILKALNSHNGIIWIRDEYGKLQPKISVGFNDVENIKELNKSKSIYECAKSGNVVIIPDVDKVSMKPNIRRIYRKSGIESIAAIPLHSGGMAVTAVLSFALPKNSGFSIEQTEFLNLSVGVLGPAIENVKLRSDLNDRANRLAMLEKLAKSINTGRDVGTVLNACAREIIGLVACDFGVVILINDDGSASVFKFKKNKKMEAAKQIRMNNEQLMKIAALKNAPMLFQDVESTDDVHSRKGFIDADTGSGIAVPLIYKEQLLGMLAVWSLESKHFGKREIKILEAAAEHLDVAVSNAKLYQAERAKSLELEALAKEAQHRIKNNLQMITGLLSMSENGDKSSKRVIEKCLRQINAISTVHELLHPGNMSKKINIDECIRRVAHNAVVATGRGEYIDLVISGDGCSFSTDAATAVGVIVNELVSNAVEHGFKGRDKGRIEVKIFHENGFCIVEVIDNGNGLPKGFVLSQSSYSTVKSELNQKYNPDFTASGLGLVSSLVMHGLGGKFEIENVEKGTRARISFLRELKGEHGCHFA